MAQIVRVAGSAAGVAEAALALDAFASERGLPREVLHALQVALDELLSNAVRHGYGGGGSEIELLLDVRDGCVELIVADEAPAFDPLSRADPDTGAPLAQRALGGLGIFLVKRLMDSVEYERRDGRNRVRVLKRIG